MAIVRHHQGCHRCGGFPGSPSKSVATLFQCGKCGFYTCNFHLSGVIDRVCPNCGGKGLAAVLSEKDVKGMARGGAALGDTVGPNSDGGAGGGVSAPRPDRPDNVPQQKAAGGGIAASLAAGEAESITSLSSQKVQKVVHDFLGQHLPWLQGQKSSALPKKDVALSVGLSSAVLEKDELTAVMPGAAAQQDGGLEEEHENGTLPSLDADVFEDVLEEDSFDPLGRVAERLGEDVPDEDDAEVLAELEELGKEKGDAAFVRTIETDAYFRTTNMAGLTRVFAFLQSRERLNDWLGVVSVESGQEDLVAALLAAMKKNKRLMAATGIGPRNARAGARVDLQGLESLLQRNRRIVALGDVGLDLHYAPHTQKEQEALLAEQLRLAAKMRLPVYLSSKRSDVELAALIKRLRREEQLDVRGVFTGMVRTADAFKMCLENNFYVLIRPEITYPEEGVYRDCLKEISKERLLLSSGDELSAPEGVRGEWNEPFYLPETIKAAMHLLDFEQKVEFLNLAAVNLNRIINAPFEASDDVFEMRKLTDDDVLCIDSVALLNNDVDVTGKGLRLVDVDDVTLKGGRTRFNRSEQKIYYTPAPHFVGEDRFEYKVVDSRGVVSKADVIVRVLGE